MEPKAKQGLLPLVIVLAILLVAAVVVSYSGGKQHLLRLLTKNTDVTSEVVTAEPTPTPTPTAVPEPKPGYQQYTNGELRYGFHYLASDVLYECSDIPCLSIDRGTVLVDTLESFQISSEDPKTQLVGLDLYCTADGPTGSRSCETSKVEDFTNSLGFKGYKITRTLTVTGTGGGMPAGNYPDVAYVYLLPEVKKGPGLLDFAAIMFAVDTPVEANLLELHAVADTYFTF